MKELHQARAFGMPQGTKKGNAVRKAGLNMLKDLRNGPGLHHQEWGTVMLHIPPMDFQVICARWPDLLSPDHEINTKAWDKFMNSPESEPYRVRSSDGKKGISRQSSIIVPENIKK